jgi:hypothetical protein
MSVGADVCPLYIMRCQTKGNASVTETNTESSTKTSAGRRTRSAHPARIELNDDELVRNDLIAAEVGTSERSVNRGDANGAPFVLVGGIKYRPIKAYRTYLAEQIKRKNQPQRRRARR